MSPELRPAHCPVCDHIGRIPRNIATTARLRCTACGETSLVREAVGDRPCRRRRPSRARAMRAEAAREVLQRLGDPELNDPLADLFVVTAVPVPGRKGAA
jgi:hypothetical protein